MKKFVKRGLRKPYRLARNVTDRRNFLSRFQRRQSSLDPVASSASGSSADDSDLIDRVVKAYRTAAVDVKDYGDSMWHTFFDDFHREIHDAMMSNRRGEIERVLRNPASSDLFYGFESLSRSLLGNPRLEEHYAPALTLDALVSLAEAVGVRRVENPETYAGLFGHPARADEIVDLLESTFNFKLAVPNPFPREFGLASKRGVISSRVPQAIYQAWRIAQLVAEIPNPRIAEIGGGLGRTALYCRQFGIADYTIIDLPITALAQGYFLGRVIGGENVRLFGESTADAVNCVKIAPPKDFLESSDQYELVICGDALTEFDESVARAYIREISTRAGIFISINHEANNFTVNQLISACSNVGSASRAPAWLRRGYVEEIVYFDRARKRTNPANAH